MVLATSVTPVNPTSAFLIEWEKKLDYFFLPNVSSESNQMMKKLAQEFLAKFWRDKREQKSESRRCVFLGFPIVSQE